MATSSPTACPPWPVAGPAVAAELETVSAGDHPAFWSWMGRLTVLRDQLARCRGDV